MRGRLRIHLIPNRNPIPILCCFGFAERIKSRNRIRRKAQASKAECAISDRLNGRRRRVPGPALSRLRRLVQDALGIR